MNNKTFIIIGLIICLLFTIPMVSAAEVSADSDLIDNSVIGSNINSQAIATSDVNALENNIDNINSNTNEDIGAGENIDAGANIDDVPEIDIDSNNNQNDTDDETTDINSGKNNKNSNDKNNLGVNALTDTGDGNTFTDLKYLIDTAIANGDTTFTLPRDFVFTSGDDDSLINGITIASPITINGGSHTIDGSNLSRIFVVTSNNVFLNNIIFKNANASSTNSLGANGGAIYVEAEGTNTDYCGINNSTFINCYALKDGGAVYIKGDYFTLSNSTFINNTAGDDGGAIDWEGDYGKIYNVTATNNSAISYGTSNSKGGTMIITGSNMDLDRVTISNSRTKAEGSGTDHDEIQGGAIFLTGNNVNVTNSAFTNCSVEYDGDNASAGALYVIGNDVNIVNCNFTNNSATEYGGALYISGDNVALNNTVFINNTAHNDGGAIQWDGDYGKVYNLTADGNHADGTHGTSKGGTMIIRGSNIVIDKAQIKNSYVDTPVNTKVPQGGAIAISGNGGKITNSAFTNCSVKNGNDSSSGGALYIWGNDTAIVGCNFTNNSAIEDGGAIYIEGNDCTLNNTVFLENVAHNDGGAIEWHGNNGVIYNFSAIKNYADSAHGSSKGGTLIVTGSNMNIDKATITDSYVEGGSSANNVQGGAIFLTGNNTNITNSVFTGCHIDYNGANASGGALYILGNFTKVENCNFTGNVAHQDGGAMYVSGSDVSVVDSNFVENLASQSGGAIFLIDNKNSQINGSTFKTNVALVNGGAIEFYAGAEDGLVSSCEFVDNSAWGAGGSVYWEGTRGIVEYSNFTGSRATGAASTPNSGRGGSVIWLGDRGEMRECIFNDSVSKKEGSALYIIGNDFAAYASNFTNSKSEESSGTIYIQGTYAKIGDCFMDNNTVKEKGAGIFVKGNFISISGTTINNSASGNAGSAVYVEGNRTEIKNSLISNNKANTSGAVYIAGSKSTVSNVDFENNTAKTSAGAIYVSGDDTIITESNFTNNTAYKGGAILYEGKRITISYSNFTLNRANGASDAKGGSISIKGKSGDSIIGCNFKDSSSGSSGGSIHWLAGGEGGLIQNCTFVNSSTDGISVTGQGHGGAIIWEANTNGVIDNCTFIDCVAKGTKNGGAIYMGTSSSSATNPVITNCVVVNCTNGERGTINIYGINATLENITFINLTALDPSRTNGFHAIEFENLVTGRVVNCTFENINGTFDGGAIRVLKGSNIVFADNKFINVNSTRNGGAFYSTGVSGNQIIENNTFINCSSVNQGGALYANNKITSFKNNTFINNSGVNQGGAVYSNTALTVTDSYFESNSAESGSTNIRGGAVYVNSGGMTVDNSTFIANSAIIDGGALYAGNNGNIKISNSTFEHNTAGNSGGVLFTGGSTYVNESSTLMHNNATSGSAIKAKSVYINDTVLLENQAHFREWADRSHTMSSNHATISGTFRGEDNLLNAINADNYAFKNVIYCGINGETTNTDDVTSAKSYNEVHQLIVLEIYNAENELVDTIEQYTDANGHYTFDFDLEDASNHAYKVIHPEDNYYTGAEYTIGKAMSNLTISSQNITHPEDENITFIVTGAGDIPTGNITIFINDTNGNVIYNDTIILNASAQASITLPRLNATEYYINAKYNGDDNYLPDNETDVFHVDMAESFIGIGAQNYTYNETGNITITVPYIESGRISVIVSNDEGYAQSYTIYVDEGTEEVKFELPILDAGNYTVDAVFYGNNNYFPSDNTTNFTVFKAASIIDVSANNVSGGERSTVDIHVDPEVATQNVNVTVYDSEGNPVAEYEDLGLLDSRTSITLPVLPKGKYNVTVHYAGDKNHNESDNETIFYVTNDLFPVDIEAINLTYGEDQIINITVPANANPNNLYIKLNWTGNDTVTNLGYTIDENGIIHIDTADLANRLNVGNYTIDVFYTGDGDFLSNSSKFTFEVVPADVEMIVTPQNITFGSIENITVEIPKLNEIGQNEALDLYVTCTNDESIQFSVQNLSIGEDGKVTWNVSGEILPAGEYTVKAVYKGSDNFNPLNKTASFTVSKAEAWIEIDVNNIFVGENEVINITVHPNGENGVTGNVTIYVRDKEETLQLDENGKASYTLTDEVEGTGVTVLVLYNGDNNYNATRNSTHYNVTKQNTTTTVDALSPIKYGTIEDLNITVNSTEATGTIILYINSTVDGFNNITKTFTLTTDDEGKVNWDIDELILPVGTYDVTAVYSGDRKFNNSTSQIKLIVVEQNEEYEITVEANNTVYGQDEIIIVTVPSDANGTVTISIDGREIETKEVSGGKAIFNVTGLEVHDNYNVTATYNGDANYKAGNTASDLFNVTKAASHIDVVAEDIDYTQIENITVSLPDTNASGKLVITINNSSGVVRTQTIDEFSTTEGVIYPFEGLLAGNYTVKVVYSEDHNYNDSEDSYDFEVRKVDPTLTESSPDITYGQDENITVTIAGAEGGLAPTGTIEVKVDGETIKTITIGEEDLEYIVIKPEVDPKHNITVIYSGDDNYNPVTITGEFAVSQNSTIELEEDSPNIVYGNNETITITLPNDATGTVYLVVNGTYYTPIGIDENHQAVFNIVAPIVGEYNFTAYYSGDGNYTANNITGAFNVTKADVELTENHAATITYGVDNTITVTITGVEGPEGVLAPTGTIKVLVDGDEIGNVTIGDDLVFTSIKPFVDSQHNITIIYSGDNNYNDKTLDNSVLNTLVFEVTKNNTVEISEVSPDINYGENETITVTIAGDATGTITVTVGGEQVGEAVTITEITEDDKVFTFNITKPDGGVYDDLTVVYGGDSNYDSRTINGEFTVSPIDPDITEDSPDIVYTNNENIAITVPGGATGTLTVTVKNSKGETVETKELVIGTDDLVVTLEKPAVDNYTLTVEYSGCANYTAKTIEGEFKVTKASNEITVVPTNITYGQTETITVTVPEGATGSVTITIGSYTDTLEIPEGSSEVVFSIPKTTADELLNVNENYVVFANYSGDGNFESAIANAPFHVDPANTTLTIDVANITYGEDEIINITVNGVENGAIPDGFVTITLNGTDISITKGVDGEGKVQFNVSGLVVGEYTVNATFESSSINYNDSNNTAKFNVTKADIKEANMNITAINITYGDDETITVTFNENNITGNVTITINGTQIETKELEDGKAVFTVPDLEVNGYNVVANYSGDDNYNAIAIEDNFNTDFKVDKANVTVEVTPVDIVYKETEEINVTVTGVFINDMLGDNLTGKVTIYIDGVENQTKDISDVDENGILHFTVEGLAVGMHNVTAVYHDDRNYNDKNATKDFEVLNALPENMQVIPQNITYHIQTETITVDLGESLTGTVQLYINDTLVATFDVADQSSVTYTNTTLAVGNYTAKAVFTANGDSVEASANFTVSKAPTTVNVEAQNITYGGTETITVTVDNTVPDKFNLTGNVSITINGIYYGNKTVDANGQAVFEIDGLEANENYQVIASYYNDPNYEDNTGSDTFKVSKADVKDANKNITAINITYGEDETITVTLNEDNITGKVTITINGTEIETKELEDGKAVFTVKDLEVNGYNVVANYSGDTNYNPFTIGDNLNTDFTVGKANSTVEVTAVPTIVYGNNETITVTVPIRNHTGTITLTINGTDYQFIKHLTAEDGDTIELTNVSGLAVGLYNVTVKYDNDRNYNDSEDYALFEVIQATPTNITVTPQNITYTEDEIITVTVGDENATGKITIRIEGTDIVKEAEIENGEAKFNVTGLVVGHYTVVANYSGDANYTSLEVSAPFHVDKAASNVTIEVANITYGETEYANITIPNDNASGRVIIKVDGEAYDILPLTNDTPVNLELSGLAVGTHTIDVEYFDDENYNKSIAHAEFNVTKADIPEANITVDPTNITYLDDETITVTVNVTNATGNVTIRINGTDVVLTKNITEEGSNTVTFTVPGLVVGDYNVTVEYTGDANYNDKNASALFTVSPAASNVTVEAVNITYLDNETITVTVPITNASGTVVVKVNGTTVDERTVSGDNPSYTINVPNLAVGEYNVTVEYSNDPNYNNSDASTLFHVDKRNITQDNITVVPTNITYLNDETITVTVDIPNATGKVTIYINGTEVETKNITSEGSNAVTFTVPNLAVGEYEVVAKYTDDANYNDADATAPFHVDPIASSVTVVPTNITYGENETITVSVPITNASGTVVVKINGTEVNRTTFDGTDNPTITISVPDLAVGEYNVTVEYIDDPNYNSSNASALFHVDKANIPDANVTVVPTNITYLDDETITVTIDVSNATGNVTIKINGTDVVLTKNITEEGSNTVTFTVPGLVVGEYNVTVEYTGDANYNDTNASAPFHVDKAASNVTVEPINITYGENETITVTVPIDNATGKVTITIKGTEVELSKNITEDGSNTVTFTVPGLVVGEYNVTAKYSDDANYNDSEASALFNVKQSAPVNLTVEATNVTYGENVTVTVTVPDDATGSVTITIGDYTETKEITPGSNKVEFTVPDLEVNNYVVYANYSGDSNYESGLVNAPFHVDKANSTVIVEAINITYGEDETITVTVPNNNATGWVTVSVNGTEIGSKKIDSDGKAVFTVKDLEVGEYEVTVVYDGDKNYNGNNNVTKFTVSKANIPDANVTVVPTNITYLDDETITVTIDVTNATGNVTIKINGTDVELTKNITEEGSNTVTFTVPGLVVGDYNVTVEYTGDANYNDTNASALFTVSPLASNVTVEAVNITYLENETITVSVPITNASGKVVVKVNGTVVDERTVSGDNPSYTINVPDLAVGEYNVTVEYSDDPNYNSSNASTIFHVDKANVPDANMTVVPTNITYLDDETIVVTVNVTNATGKVTITVNGTDVDLTESVDSDGKATFTVPGLAVGEYNVTAVYHDDVNYNDANASALFHVDPIASSVTVVPTNITYLENETITVSVPITNASGTAVVKINGTEVNRTTFNGENNPTITISVPDLAVGEYNVTVEYIDDPNYNDSEASALFHVDKASVPDANVTVVPTNITYLDDETITVTIDVSNATGNVTIKINGTDVVLTKNITEEGSNTVTFTVPGLVVGEYNVTVEYTGDANYNDTNASALFTVSPAASNVTVEPINITYGENETITVTVPIDNATGKVTITINGTTVELSKNITEEGSNTVTFTVPGLAVGEYNVTAKYTDDANYNDSEASALFNVKQSAPVNLTVEATNVTYGENVTVTVTVPDDATGSVTITIGDYTETKDITPGVNTVEFTVPDLEVNNYVVYANYSGDSNYESGVVNAPFHVDKANSTVVVEAINITYGEDETITVTVPNNNATGWVTVRVNGTEIGSKKIDADGKAVFTVKDLEAGEYEVTVVYDGDRNYNGNNNITSFTVSKANIADANVTVVPTNITYLDDETITVTINVNNATGNVTIKINGTDVELTKNITEDGSNTVTFTVPGLAVGEYNVTVEYTGDANYNDTNASALFHVDPAASNVNVSAVNITYLDNETITVTVPISNASGTVVVKVNGTEVNRTTFSGVDNPTIEVIVPDLAVGEYNVTVEYIDDPNYNDSDASTLFHVDKANIPDVPDSEGLVVVPTNITYGDDETITVTLDVPNATGKVTISINGTDVETKDIGAGTVTFTVPGLAVGEYNVTAKYTDDPNYNDYNVSALFHVDPAASNVNVSAVNITYNDDETITVGVNVTNASGTVVVKINGTEVNRTTFTGEDKPTIDVIVPGLAAGEYNVTVEYIDDPNYNNSDASALFHVDKDNITDINVNPTNITYGDNETITVTIGDNNVTGNITIKINGTEYGPQELVDGSTTFNVPGLVAGDYTVEAIYSGDDNYNATTASADFTVDRTVPDMDVNTSDIDYNETENIVITLPEDATGTVNVTVTDSDGNKINFTDVPVGPDGKVTIPVDDLPAGDYDVSVDYSGDDNYNATSGTGSFSVDKIDSTVTVNATDITYGDNETIKYSVPEDATGTVNITVVGDNGVTKVFMDVPVENGTIGVNVTDLPAGNYNVTVQYSGDNNYNPSTGKDTFTVDKAVPDMDVNTSDIDYNETENIVITLPEDATGTVNVTVTDSDGNKINFTDVPVGSDGKVTIPVDDLPAGDYDVTVDYSGDDNYNATSGTGSFSVSKIDPSMDVNTTDITYGENETVKVTLPEDATGKVNITVTGDNGISKTYNDVEVGPDGTVSIPIEDLTVGNYDVNVTYGGDKNYNALNASSSFKVDKAKPNTYAVGTNITYGNEDQITAIVDGKNITGNVTIFIDGVEIDTINLTQTDTGGRAVINVPGLSGGDHTVKVVYNGDDNHNSSEGQDTFNVRKAEPTMEINVNNIDYGDTEKINITVSGVNGGATPTGEVTVTVTDENGNNQTFTKPINPDGTVTVEVPGLAVGTYNVTVNYPGDENYTSVNGTSKFSVGKITPDVDVDTSDITYGQNETIEVTLPSDAKGNVTIIVKDKDGNVIKEENVTLTDGKASIEVGDLAAGDYNVTVEYPGDNNYGPSSGKANFTVAKAESGLKIDTDDIDYHDSEEITVNVTGVEGGVTPTGNVTITVTDEDGNNQTFTKPIGSDGTVKLTVDDLPAGKYNVTVEYPGDENYTAVNGKANFTVNQIATPIDLETKNITYGDNETLTVTVPSDATGNVTITIKDKGGNVIKEETVNISDGTAKLTVPDLNAGNYTVHVEYPGDNNYKSNSTDGEFEVAKANATVEIHVYDIIYGDIEELTVTCNAPGNVTIYVNGKNVTLPLENGYAHIVFANALSDYSGNAQWDLENLAVGTYPARVHYNGNENYNEDDDDDVFHVIQANTTTIISVDDIKVGEDAVINVEVTHETGSEVISGPMTVTVDGTDYTVILTNGKGSLTVSGLKAGEHTVEAKYPGSHNYTNSSNSTTFKVKKHSPTVKITDEDIKVGDDETITVNVPKDATGNVTITVGGKTYTAQVEDGKAVFKVPGLKAGKYTVKAHYSGDAKYLPADSSDKFTVSKVKPDIDTNAPTIKVGQDGKVTVKVPKDATGTVTITVNGKKYTATVKDGKAVFHVPGLKAGKYPIKVHYSGDDKYKSSTVDGGEIEVLPNNDSGHGGKAVGHNGIDIESKSTGNPILVLLLVFVFLGFLPFGRKKDDEEDEKDNP